MQSLIAQMRRYLTELLANAELTLVGPLFDPAMFHENAIDQAGS
ncbi:hypothetical protein ACFTZB_41090 [Rhodococcus sp. NPDC057014]